MSKLASGLRAWLRAPVVGAGFDFTERFVESLWPLLLIGPVLPPVLMTYTHLDPLWIAALTCLTQIIVIWGAWRYARYELRRRPPQVMSGPLPPKVSERKRKAREYGVSRWGVLITPFLIFPALDIFSLGSYVLIARGAGANTLATTISVVVTTLFFASFLLILALFVWVRPKLRVKAEQEFRAAVTAMISPASGKIEALQQRIEELREQLTQTLEATDEVDRAVTDLSRETESSEESLRKIVEASDEIEMNAHLMREMSKEDIAKFRARGKVLDSLRQPEKRRSRLWDVFIGVVFLFCGALISQLIPDGALAKILGISP